MEQLIGYSDLAESLRVSEITLRKMVSARRIPFCKIGRSVRFRPSEIDAWLHQNGWRTGVPSVEVSR
jgi:excisionase family DNA binding protein